MVFQFVLLHHHLLLLHPDVNPLADQRKSTSRSSTGRAKSTRSFRVSLRSAVPDTSIITMAQRPDQGGSGNSKNINHPLKILLFSSISGS